MNSEQQEREVGLISTAVLVCFLVFVSASAAEEWTCPGPVDTASISPVSLQSSNTQSGRSFKTGGLFCHGSADIPRS